MKKGIIELILVSLRATSLTIKNKSIFFVRKYHIFPLQNWLKIDEQSCHFDKIRSIMWAEERTKRLIYGFWSENWERATLERQKSFIMFKCQVGERTCSRSCLNVSRSDSCQERYEEKAGITPEKSRIVWFVELLASCWLRLGWDLAFAIMRLCRWQRHFQRFRHLKTCHIAYATLFITFNKFPSIANANTQMKSNIWLCRLHFLRNTVCIFDRLAA